MLWMMIATLMYGCERITYYLQRLFTQAIAYINCKADYMVPRSISQTSPVGPLRFATTALMASCSS